MFTKSTGQIYRRTQTVNKRIRKKREQQQTAQAIRQLAACYRQWEQEREEKYRRLEEKYGIII